MLHSNLPALAAAGAVPILHASDETLLRLWLDGRSRHTQLAYEADVRGMLATVVKPIGTVTLADLQAWTNSLPMAALAPASRARKIGAVKSLLSFAEKTGLLPFNVGAALRVPPVKNVLAERILEEELGFQGAEEALHRCIVPAVSLAAH